jgi:hypothetical protein
MTRTLSILAAVAALAVSADAASAGTSQKPAKPSKASYTLENTMISGYAAAQGIIMRDGGICDPIRQMGC